MSDELKQAFALLFGAARQARLSADEHQAVHQAAVKIETALTPKAPDAPKAEESAA